jgi:hypothetical protein
LAERTSFWFAEETNCSEIGPERPQRPSNCAIRARLLKPPSNRPRDL